MRRRRLQTARACLEALGHSGDAADVDRLAKVMALEQGELAAAAALALGATGCAAAEPPLILALQERRRTAPGGRGESAGPRRHGRGRAAAEGSDPALRQQPRAPPGPRQAIAEIQSRLPGASPGQLSLAGVEVGQLSLAQAEAGQLSLAADPAGQLSLQPKEQRNRLPPV